MIGAAEAQASSAAAAAPVAACSERMFRFSRFGAGKQDFFLNDAFH